jgi:hypothetical protein
MDKQKVATDTVSHKKSEVLMRATTRINLGNMLSEGSQSQKPHII